jgi:hypothetical protein
VELLRPTMAATARAAGAPSRVVLLSSESHRHPPAAADGGPIRFERLNDAKGYSALANYGQSKLCNLLHARCGGRGVGLGWGCVRAHPSSPPPACWRRAGCRRQPSAPVAPAACAC